MVTNNWFAVSPWPVLFELFNPIVVLKFHLSFLLFLGTAIKQFIMVNIMWSYISWISIYTQISIHIFIWIIMKRTWINSTNSNWRDFSSTSLMNINILNRQEMVICIQNKHCINFHLAIESRCPSFGIKGQSKLA